MTRQGTVGRVSCHYVLAGVSLVTMQTRPGSVQSMRVSTISPRVIDAAVKAVVTESIRTTLPTATIKVCTLLLW